MQLFRLILFMLSLAAIALFHVPTVRAGKKAILKTKEEAEAHTQARVHFAETINVVEESEEEDEELKKQREKETGELKRISTQALREEKEDMILEGEDGGGDDR
eukprot:GHVS01057969.1.p1 GENE.GHVS01057969.1~~GHVS01057969.1.p1  ORF type:complete len:104 (-),score=25.57 GHVS01057969.1:146-457(-)